MTISSTKSFQSLDQLMLGENAVVMTIQVPLDCACRLRSMGLCEGSSICVLHNQDPVIIQCEQTCMAICRSLLKDISVSRHDVLDRQESVSSLIDARRSS